MAIQQNFPSTRPSLNLNFARSKTLDPRITFTRTSSATYVDENGLVRIAPANSPRFDHNPVTGESLGLLIEEQRVNIATSSENWNSFQVISNVGVTTDTTIAPDGTQTADTLTCTASGLNNDGIIQKLTNISANTSWYTCSWFIKNNGASESSVQIAHSGGTYIAQTVKIDWNILDSNGLPTFTSNFINGTANRIIHPVQAFPNGWFRFSVSQQNNGTNTQITNRIYVSSASSTVSGDSVHAWGAQMEEGQFPTSYIPTTVSTATRTADNANITGANFNSGWYNPNEGTVYTDTKIVGIQTSRFDRLWAITNSNLNLEGISVYISGPGAIQGQYIPSITITNSATEQINGDIPPVISAFSVPSAKYAFTFKTNNANFAFNGVIRSSDDTTVGILTTTDRLLIGQPQRFQGHPCVIISKLTYYPSRLPNNQLVTLTK